MRRRLLYRAAGYITVENGLPEGTTLHWHGIRLPNPMDGVPDVVQPPIATG